MNLTSSIKYLYLALPTIRHVVEPMVLVTIQSFSSATFSNVPMDLSIFAGNDGNHYDVAHDVARNDTGNTRDNSVAF